MRRHRIRHEDPRIGERADHEFLAVEVQSETAALWFRAVAAKHRGGGEGTADESGRQVAILAESSQFRTEYGLPADNRVDQSIGSIGAFGYGPQ